MLVQNTMPSNKELKLTKPAQAMELRSLTPVFGGLVNVAMTERAAGPRAIPVIELGMGGHWYPDGHQWRR